MEISYACLVLIIFQNMGRIIPNIHNTQIWICAKRCVLNNPGNGLFVGRMRGAKIEDNYCESNNTQITEDFGESENV